MKTKTIIIASAAVAVSVAVSVALVFENFRSESAIIFDANVEALTRGESSGFGPMCSQTGKSGDRYMKLCSNCNAAMRYYDFDRVAFCND